MEGNMYHQGGCRICELGYLAALPKCAAGFAAALASQVERTCRAQVSHVRDNRNPAIANATANATALPNDIYGELRVLVRACNAKTTGKWMA